MTYFLVDDRAHSHPKFIAAGNAAIGLWTRAGAYCSDHCLGGVVPTAVARQFGTRGEIARLVEVGLWIPVAAGWRFHDWEHINPTAEEAKERKRAKHEAKVAAGRAGGLRSGQTRRSKTEADDQAEPEPTGKRGRTPTHHPPHPPLSKSPPPPQDSRGGPPVGGGGIDARYHAAIEHAVDLEQAGEPNPIERPGPWRKSVRSRLETQFGALALRLLEDPTATPEHVGQQILDTENGHQGPGLSTPKAPLTLEPHLRSRVRDLLAEQGEGEPDAAGVLKAITEEFPDPAFAAIVVDELYRETGWTPVVATVTPIGRTR